MALVTCGVTALCASWMTGRITQRRWQRWHRHQTVMHLCEPLVRSCDGRDTALDQCFQQWAEVATRHPDLIRAALVDPADRPILVYPPGPFDTDLVGAAPEASYFEVATRGFRGTIGDRRVTRLAMIIQADPSPVGHPFAAAPFWPAVLATAVTLLAAVRLLIPRLERPVADFLHDANALLGDDVETSPVAARGQKLLDNIDALRRDAVEWHGRTQQLQRILDDKVQAETKHLSVRLRRAERRAAKDALTGLDNRQYMEQRLNDLFELHAGADRDLSVIMLDIDHFKTLNDTLGHQAGDELLQFVGAIILSHRRAEDLAIRYGGDEFLIALPDTTGDQAAVTAQRLSALFAQHSVRLSVQPSPTMCAGVASLKANRPGTLEDLIKQADAALYQAKRSGRNQVVTAEAVPCGNSPVDGLTTAD